MFDKYLEQNTNFRNLFQKSMVQNIFVVNYNLFSVSKVGICHARKYHFLVQLCF